MDELTDVLSALDENAFHIEDVQVSGGERVGERERERVRESVACVYNTWV